MTDETTSIPNEQDPTPNYEEIAINLNESLKQYQFFSDQVKFNATLFNGLQILLDKVTKIEEKLNGDKK